MNDSNYEAFTSWSVPRALFKFVTPAVISMLATLIFNLTDAFFVGRTGDTFQISAMTITLPIVMTMTATSMVFGAGGNANVSASLGAGQYEKAKQFSAFSLWTALAVIGTISIGIWAVQMPVLRLLGANDDSIRFCQGYIRWVFHAACIPMVFAQVVSQLFSAQGDTKIAGIGIACAGLLNAILDPIFIFTLRLGIVGAGVATCISNYCAMAYFLVMYVRKEKTASISLSLREYRPGNGIAAETLAIGLSAGLSIILMNCIDFLRNYLFGVNGTQADLAAWGVVQKLGNAFLQICIGIANGVRPLVAFNFNAGAKARTKAIIKGSLMIVGCYTGLCFLLVMGFPQAFVTAFLPIETVIPTAIQFLRIYIFFLFGIGFQELLNSVFQALGQWRLAMGSVAVGKAVLTVPIILILTKLYGVVGIIAAQPVSDTLIVAMMTVGYFFFVRKWLVELPDANEI